MRKAGAFWLVLVLAAAGLSAASQEKPNFSGVWVVNPQKSQLADWAKFDTTTITIDHQEPKFLFHRLSLKGGKADESSYELTTDGVEKVEKEGGRIRASRLTWDGETIVFYSRMVLPDGREAVDTVRYSLKDGGKTFVAEEKFRGPIVKYDNLWVADKKEEPKS